MIMMIMVMIGVIAQKMRRLLKKMIERKLLLKI